MDIDARASAWVALQISGIGPRPLLELLRTLGSPEAVLAATPAQRRAIVTVSHRGELDLTSDDKRLEAALEWLADTPDASLVAWDDPDYPAALLEIHDPPPVFYCRGRRDLLSRPALAIVGSRNGTPQGCTDAEAFATALSAGGLTIVSGLALGIDAAAHRGGLLHPGSSIAVIGTGPDRVYPAKNRDLAHKLAASGAIVSEFVPGTPPVTANFPRRNRLISGLSRGVLVVEAALASGSLITARLAAEQGREVFALPGSIHSPLSKGCHRLIREGAKLVETAQDVFDELRLPVVVPGMATGLDGAGADPADPDATVDAPTAILSLLTTAPSSVDELAQGSGLEATTVLSTLTQLELAGRASALPGARWQRLG